MKQRFASRLRYRWHLLGLCVAVLLVWRYAAHDRPERLCELSLTPGVGYSGLFYGEARHAHNGEIFWIERDLPRGEVEIRAQRVTGGKSRVLVRIPEKQAGARILSVSDSGVVYSQEGTGRFVLRRIGRQPYTIFVPAEQFVRRVALSGGPPVELLRFRDTPERSLAWTAFSNGHLYWSVHRPTALNPKQTAKGRSGNAVRGGIYSLSQPGETPRRLPLVGSDTPHGLSACEDGLSWYELSASAWRGGTAMQPAYMSADFHHLRLSDGRSTIWRDCPLATGGRDRQRDDMQQGALVEVKGRLYWTASREVETPDSAAGLDEPLVQVDLVSADVDGSDRRRLSAVLSEKRYERPGIALYIHQGRLYGLLSRGPRRPLALYRLQSDPDGMPEKLFTLPEGEGRCLFDRRFLYYLVHDRRRDRQAVGGGRQFPTLTIYRFHLPY